MLHRVQRETSRLSRRAFLGAAAIGSAAIGVGARAAIPTERRWAAVRGVVASGIIGSVRVASAIVPLDGDAGLHDAQREWHGKQLPAAVAECLDGLFGALALQRPAALNTAAYAGTFSITCVTEDGRRVAIAGVASSPFSMTVRGTAGSLRTSNRRIQIESQGRWREVRF